MTVKSSSFLSPRFIKFLHRTAKSINHHERMTGRRQWIIANATNAEWRNLSQDLRDEITKELFMMEVSEHLNEVLPFPLVSASGETLDYWCKIAATYANVPNLEVWQEALSFDHFRRAKKIALDPSNNLTSPMDALARAYEMKWTAGEMEDALTKEKPVEPRVLELRAKYPEWLWRAAYPLLTLNGNRGEAERHLLEYRRLVEDDQKSNQR
jgi:predicted nucleic acid-binding protein